MWPWAHGLHVLTLQYRHVANRQGCTVHQPHHQQRPQWPRCSVAPPEGPLMHATGVAALEHCQGTPATTLHPQVGAPSEADIPFFMSPLFPLRVGLLPLYHMLPLVPLNPCVRPWPWCE